ncbi:MAG: DedA family protein [Planctomycetes bacterium]|nr:DedA family protein [Planctomycetota bacterium]
MDEVYVNLLSTYGPVAVFLLLMLTGFGIPLGEDLVVIPAGILIAHGDLNGPLTAACAYLGVLGADFLWFAICHQYGTPLLHKRWFKRVIHPRRLLQIKHELERRGTWVIVMARFIPGSRTPVITSAGVLHLAFWKFALAESACCLVTVPLQLGLGYSIARGVGTKETTDMVRLLIGVVVLILAVLICLAWWRARHSERRRRPRAKAAWLRRFRVPHLRRQR